MCLKFDSEQNEIFLLECTSNLGVHLKRFSNMKQHIGNFYQKIALRHLDFERSEENLEQLEKFITDSLGKEYTFSVNQLRSRQTMIMGSRSREMTQQIKASENTIETEPEFENPLMQSMNPGSFSTKLQRELVVEEERKFFCSELIAKAFKVCKIMEDNGEACSNYLPSNFSSKKFTLPLLKHIKLDSEKTLCFGQMQNDVFK